jgi:DNA polymerase-3 subunit alpha (Gram-positive type)
MGFNRKGIDTLRIARACLPELESRALPSLCNYFGISLQAHRALHDARATHEVYQILCKEFGEKEEISKLFEPRDLVYQVKRQRPITMHQKERITRFVQQYGIDFDIEIDSLTKNEADRRMDLWKLQYGK